MDSIKIERWLKEKRAIDYVINNYDIPSHIERILENMSYAIQEEYDNYKKRKVEQEKLDKEGSLIDCCVAVKKKFITSVDKTNWRHIVYTNTEVTTLYIRPNEMMIRVKASYIPLLKEILGNKFIITTVKKYY